MTFPGIYPRLALLAMALTGTVLSTTPAARAADQNPTAALKAKLNGSQYKNVQVTVDSHGVATLSEPFLSTRTRRMRTALPIM